VGDDERAARVEELMRRFSELTAQLAVLASEAKAFAANISEIRKEHGNPFFYSGVRHGRPENADKTIRKFSGYKAHEPGLSVTLKLLDISRQLAMLRDELREMGIPIDSVE
jgi:hypothetical protein